MSQLTNTPQKQIPLRLEARKSYVLGLWFTALDAGKNRHLVDLTGSTITLHVAALPHKGGALVLTETAVLTDPTVGHAQLQLQALDLDLAVGEYDYTITYLTAEDYSVVAMKGTFEVLYNPNPATDNVFVTDDPTTVAHVLLTHDNHVTVQLTKGLKGDDGVDGIDGDNGDSAYEVAVAEGFVGTVAQWLASLEGTDGDNGLSAYEVAVAEGFVGSAAAWLATLNGADGEDGTDGTDGDSAYEVAVANGFVGNQAAWLASLEGTDGADGDSAYEVAVANGFVGNEAAWLASLVGDDGDPGAPGDDGLSAYEVAVANGFVGTEAEWLTSLEGEDGAPGELTGAAGGVLGGNYPNPTFAEDMATQAELTAHLDDAADAHDASAISFAAGGGIVATDVQSAIAEVRADAMLDGEGAGGVLSGNYPNPGFAVDMAEQSELNTVSDLVDDHTVSIDDIYDTMAEGAASSTDNEVVRFDGVTGKVIQGSATPVTISDAGSISLPASQTVDGRDVSVDGAKLDGIEANADVTDAANVAAAGAHMAGGTDVPVTDGGTGRSTGATAYGLIAAGTTATGAQQTIAPGTAGQFLKSGGGAALGAFAAIAIGDVTSLQAALDAKAAGGASSTDNEIVRFDGVTGKALQGSANPVTISDAGSISLPASQTVDGRDVSVDGAKLDGIEANADVTDATNVAAAGAVMPTSTQTLTNKRITKRVFSTADTATLTIDSDSYDGAKVTAQAQALTIAAPTGTPTAMQSLIIRLKDNGTARALTWNAAFRAIGVTLPVTTVISKTVYIGCIWNSDDSKWDAIAVATQA